MGVLRVTLCEVAQGNTKLFLRDWVDGRDAVWSNLTNGVCSDEGAKGGVEPEGSGSAIGSGMVNWASRYVAGEGASRETEATQVPACK